MIGTRAGSWIWSCPRMISTRAIVGTIVPLVLLVLPAFGLINTHIFSDTSCVG